MCTGDITFSQSNVILYYSIVDKRISIFGLFLDVLKVLGLNVETFTMSRRENFFFLMFYLLYYKYVQMKKSPKSMVTIFFF